MVTAVRRELVEPASWASHPEELGEEVEPGLDVGAEPATRWADQRHGSAQAHGEVEDLGLVHDATWASASSATSDR